MTNPTKTSRGGFASILLLMSVVLGIITALVSALFTIKYIEELPEKPSKPPAHTQAQEEEETLSDLSVTPEPPEPKPESGAFTDDRDAASYKTAKIGGKTWMAENLRYRAKGSWCYGDDSSNCGKYGGLYAWNTAKTVCPAGWRLPARVEWLALAEAAGGQEIAGKRLKAKSGWDEDGNGTDSRGFSALPGGSRHHIAGDFSYAGSMGFWWTSTEYGDGGASGNAYIRTMNYSDDELSESYSGKGGGLSVRCVKDD
jgi:uncharacterized protein (TIGR02145 family)